MQREWGLWTLALFLLSCGGSNGAATDLGGKEDVTMRETVVFDSQGPAEVKVELEVAQDVNRVPDLTVVLPAPLFERGQVIPPNSLPCEDVNGGETTACNHHGSSVAVAEDGTVMVVWYHGRAEKSKDSRIVWSRRSKGAEFGPAEVLFDDPGLAEGNPAIWVGEDGTIFLFFVTIMGESWNDAQVRLIRSHDGGESWSAVQVLRDSWGWMVRNHPLRLSNGNLLVPLYDETLYIPAFMLSSDDFVTNWMEVALGDQPEALVDHLSMIQGSVIQRTSGELYCLNRNTNMAHKMALEMTSDDFGLTWSPGVASQVPNDSTGIEMIRLSSGRVLLAFNNTTSGRYPLSLALSDDEALSWAVVADLDGPCEPGQECSHGYTSVAQDPTDQSFWVTFTDERKTIGWVHANEPWLLQQEGAFVGSGTQ